VIDRNIVSITASSIGNPQSYPLRHVADFENQSCFATNNEANSWICYDFKDMQIKVTHYSIRTRRDANNGHLRFWILEGSQDGLSWVTIDDRQNDTSLNSEGAISTFSISQNFQKAFRQVRLRQTGKNTSGTDNLIVNSIEFFGVLKEPKH
jgi:E3 ubiquitin-protein ligase HECTD1